MFSKTTLAAAFLLIGAGTAAQAAKLTFEVPAGTPPQTKISGKKDILGAAIGAKYTVAVSNLEKEGYYCEVGKGIVTILVKDGQYRGPQDSDKFPDMVTCKITVKGEYEEFVKFYVTSPAAGSSIYYGYRAIKYFDASKAPLKTDVMSQLQTKYGFSFSKAKSWRYSYTEIGKSFGEPEVKNGTGDYLEGKMNEKYNTQYVDYAFNSAVSLFPDENYVNWFVVEIFDNNLENYDIEKLEALKAEYAEKYIENSSPESAVSVPKL